MYFFFLKMFLRYNGYKFFKDYTGFCLNLFFELIFYVTLKRRQMNQSFLVVSFIIIQDSLLNSMLKIFSYFFLKYLVLILHLKYTICNIFLPIV